MRERQNTVGGAREMRVGRAGRTQAAHAVAEGESESQGQPLKIRDAPVRNLAPGRMSRTAVAIEAFKDLLLEFWRIEHSAVRAGGKPGDAIAKRVVQVVAVAGVQQEVVAGVNHFQARIATQDALERLQSDMPHRSRRTVRMHPVLDMAIEILPDGNGRLRMFHIPDELWNRGGNKRRGERKEFFHVHIGVLFLSY